MMANLLKRPKGFTKAQWDKMDRVSKRLPLPNLWESLLGQLDAMLPPPKIIKPEIPDGYKKCAGSTALYIYWARR